MKKETTAKLLRATVFLLCTAILLTFLTALCKRKTYGGPWNYMSKLNEFYALEDNTLDYICVGSSHMYCSVNPLEVWSHKGAAGFVLATQQQPLMASYYYIKEALKTQSPKVVVVEGWMGSAEDSHDSAVYYDALDPLKPSRNKLQMIRDMIPKGERKAYYFSLLKYHSRFLGMGLREMAVFAKALLITPMDIYKGFVPLDGDFETNNLLPEYDTVEASPLSQYNSAILHDMKELIEANGGTMVLMFAPYGSQDEAQIAAMKGMQLWAVENNVPVLDYACMLEDLPIDPHADYYDNGHLDVSGAAKISIHFARWLEENGIENTPGVNTTKWQADLDAYRAAFQADLNP